MGGLTLRGGRVEISRGFLVLLALLLWLDEGVGLLLPALFACALHELGHLAAIRAAGCSVKRLHLTTVGAELILRDCAALSYGKELLIALAGPAGSLLCAFIAARFGWFLLAGMCLGQGAFNLLPVLPLDGGRSLGALLAHLCGPVRAEQALTGVSAVTVGLLFGLGLLVLEWFSNLTLLLTAGWLLAGLLQRGKNGGKIEIKKKIMLAKQRKT